MDPNHLGVWLAGFTGNQALWPPERGLYGAIVAKTGLFKIPCRETIFLDEVGDVDPQAQLKLLKALTKDRFADAAVHSGHGGPKNRAAAVSPGRLTLTDGKTAHLPRCTRRLKITVLLWDTDPSSSRFLPVPFWLRPRFVRSPSLKWASDSGKLLSRRQNKLWAVPCLVRLSRVVRC